MQGEVHANVTLADELSAVARQALYRSMKKSSGLAQGMMVMGIFTVMVATVGICGSVRGSPPCLYCYAVSSMTLLVAQSIFIALLNSSVEQLDETVKTLIQDSDAAKNLVRSNGQQALYIGLFAFSIEVVGFVGSMLARQALKESILREELGGEDLSYQLDELNAAVDGDGPTRWIKNAALMRLGSERMFPVPLQEVSAARQAAPTELRTIRAI